MTFIDEKFEAVLSSDRIITAFPPFQTIANNDT